MLTADMTYGPALGRGRRHPDLAGTGLQDNVAAATWA